MITTTVGDGERMLGLDALYLSSPQGMVVVELNGGTRQTFFFESRAAYLRWVDEAMKDYGWMLGPMLEQGACLRAVESAKEYYALTTSMRLEGIKPVMVRLLAGETATSTYEIDIVRMEVT